MKNLSSTFSTACSAVFVPIALVLIEHNPALAQTPKYPGKVIRWVVPFPAGGGADVVARPIALAMGEMFGQPIVYDNRGGGGGLIAGEIVAKAAPDGYTLLVGSPPTLTVNQSLYAQMPFDANRDFAPITRFANIPNILCAHPSLPARTVQELIDYAKANPGKVNWASSGMGTGGHLGIELMQMRAGIKVVHVAYKGAAPALVGLVGGNVHLLLAGPGVFLQHIKAGRVRAIATGSLQRLAILPDLPTLHESGLPGMESGSWHGLVAPTGTPVPIIRILHAAAVKILNQPETAARLAADGAIPSGVAPEQFAKDIRQEAATWAKVIKQAGVKLD